MMSSDDMISHLLMLSAMRIPCCCCRWAFLKFVFLWALSVTITISVIIYSRLLRLDDPSPAVEEPVRRSAVPPHRDLKQEAERFVRVPHHGADLNKIFKDRNSSLEDLQFFPKLDQAKILNKVLVNRPELKKFLKVQLNLQDDRGDDAGAQAGPIIPSMSSQYEKQISLSVEDLRQPKVKYVLDVRDKCLVDPPFLLVFVHSAWHHFARRELLRQSWAKLTEFAGAKVKVVFMLGKPPPDLDEFKRLRAVSDLVQERQIYGDLVQADFTDSYRNLTLKHLAAYHWVLTHCRRAKYILKLDDDTFVSVFRLVEFLKDRTVNPLVEPDLLYCSAYVSQGPRRDPADKWYVSVHEYPGEKYPTYCEGFAYVTTPDTVLRLYNASLSIPQYWIDDVYVTGILAKHANVRHKQFRAPYGHTRTHEPEDYHQVVLHSLFILVDPSQGASVWAELWQAASQSYSTKDYTVNSRYKNLKPHLPHHTL